MGLFSRKKNKPVDTGPRKRTSRAESDENAHDEAVSQPSAKSEADVVDAADLATADTGTKTADRAETDPDAPAKSGPSDRTASGPFDASETTDDTARVDLGALQIPAIDGMQVGLDVDDKQERILSITCDFGESTLQLQAFAAPRSEGLWHDIRKQIASSISKQGGTADTSDSAFGPEVLARIPARTADGRTGVKQARFIGVDGPRWFLRAVIGGDALNNDDERTMVERVLRGVIVSRGDDPMPPRELLPLVPPAGVEDDEPAADVQDGPAIAKAP